MERISVQPNCKGIKFKQIILVIEDSPALRGVGEFFWLKFGDME